MLSRRVCLECWEDQEDPKPEIDGTEFDLAKTQQPQVDGMEILLWLKPNDLKCMEWTSPELNDLKFMEWEVTWQFVNDLTLMEWTLTWPKLKWMERTLTWQFVTENWWNGIEVLGVRLGKDSCPTALKQETRHETCLVQPLNQT